MCAAKILLLCSMVIFIDFSTNYGIMLVVMCAVNWGYVHEEVVFNAWYERHFKK